MSRQDHIWLTLGDFEHGSEPFEKASFVACELAEMIKAATGSMVDDVYYIRREPDGEERVVLLLSAAPRREVNVTCDSLWAIAKDVMRAVAEIYEG